MTDPLSITASVAGIISLADLVFTRIYKYAKAAGNAQQDVRDLADEIKAIRDLLRALSALAFKLEATPVATTFDLTYVIVCQETLQHLEDSLSKAQEDFERSKIRRLLRKLKWPFTATETRDLLNSLARQKGNIGLSLGIDSVSLILSELPRLSRLETSITQASNGIQSISIGIQNILHDTQLVDPYFKQVVIRSFMPVDPEPRLHKSLAEIEEGSHDDAFDLPGVCDWLDNPGARLAVYGPVGCGKSMFAGSLVQEAIRRRTDGTGVAYFYCSVGDARTQSPVYILGTLAAQLAVQNNEAYECLQRYYKRLYPLKTGSIATTPSVELMISILQHITNYFDRVSIIIDGLNECVGQEAEMLNALACTGNMSHVSIALLSRNEYGFVLHSVHPPLWNFSILPEKQNAFVRIWFCHVLYHLDSLWESSTEQAVLTTLQKLPEILHETYYPIHEHEGATNQEKEAMRNVFGLVAFREPRVLLSEIYD
ncbi:hypothetical protein FGRMN_5254 [Fusarium graminum]|nr:hypothetical protein FGRMN_5254 [Fusarium graminum]